MPLPTTEDGLLGSMNDVHIGQAEDDWGYISKPKKTWKSKMKEKRETRSKHLASYLEDNASGENVEDRAPGNTARSSTPSPSLVSVPQEPVESRQDASIFIQCLKCLRCDYISVSQRPVPQELVQGNKECQAAFLLIQCRACDDEHSAPRDPFESYNTRQNNDQRLEMAMHKDMLKDTKAYKTAEAIAGSNVYIASNKNNLVYARIKSVLEALTTADTIISLDLSQSDGDFSHVKLPHLRLGLV